MAVQNRRHTKYSRSVLEIMQELGHATNADLAHILTNHFPDISDTTVHRVTARLCEDGLLGLAPHTVDGSMRYDINTSTHDHFVCSQCGELRDIYLNEDYREEISRQLDGCLISGSVTISGNCLHCQQ
ncbi:hypothetical protein EOL73_01465 [Candidatus Saccharibacteria bacterium]|nr:hypothetical protein [Candidatus Saccharibacteria bacterium]NCU40404.1 hypothetical protein [Candidatus Saccharibacteria bacterium]